MFALLDFRITRSWKKRDFFFTLCCGDFSPSLSVYESSHNAYNLNLEQAKKSRKATSICIIHGSLTRHTEDWLEGEKFKGKKTDAYELLLFVRESELDGNAFCLLVNCRLCSPPSKGSNLSFAPELKALLRKLSANHRLLEEFKALHNCSLGEMEVTRCLIDPGL